MNIKREGVFATPEETKRLQELYTTMQQPVFGVSDPDMQRQVKKHDDALVAYYKGVNAEAVRLGLPEPSKDDKGDVNNYGIDFINGEIVSVG